MAKAAEAVKEKTTDKQDDSKKQVQSVEFSETAQNNIKGAGGSIEILLDMNVPIIVTIGQTEIPVRQLLQLGSGSVLTLGKPIDEPVDLYLSDTKFATGSVVVVDDCFAVKITQILGVANPDADNKEA